MLLEAFREAGWMKLVCVVAVLIAASVACAPAMRRPHAKAANGTRVVMRALPGDSASAELKVEGLCPADPSLHALTCPLQPAVVEVAVSPEGRVTKSRISRSSGSQVLDAACILSAHSCVGGQARQQGAVECSLQCE